jgi:hypothetical protein
MAKRGERERLTPMDFDNLEIIWDLLRIHVWQEEVKKMCPMDLDHLRVISIVTGDSICKSNQRSSHPWIGHFVFGC